MVKSATLWVAVFCIVGACGKRAAQGPGEHGDDGFAIGTQALSLEQASAALCGGGGADKECGPEGCATPPQAADNRAAPSTPTMQGASQPSGGAPVGVMPAYEPQPASQAPPSDFGGDSEMFSEPQAQAGSSGLAGMSGQAGTSSQGGSGGSPAPECSDAGLQPDGGMCSEDAGVANQQAALITDDVPGCADIRPRSATTLYLSADDSGSMAAPVIARRLIEAHQVVPAHVIRPWEFLNYYDFSFEPAAPGEVRIVPQLSSCPENDRLSLQVALQGEARDPSDRRALNLTFVLDTSGSMAGQPMALERAAVLAIAGQLRLGDVVSMVTWDTVQADILSGHEVTGPNDETLLAAANGLSAGGGTDLNAGLTRGYALAEQHRADDRINRVILISDGQANVGITDEQLIGRHADDEEGAEGIYLAGIGVGAGVNDTLMNAVTDAGRGAYLYLDSAQEAQHMLGERFLQVVDIAARSVRLEVTLPYYLVLEKFFGEVASTDASKVRPQHLSPNDAMLFFQVLRACDPSLLHGDDRIRLRATWRTALTREPREAVIDTTLNALAGNDGDLTKAAAIAGYAEALTAAAGPDMVKRYRVLSKALEDVQAAQNADSDPDLLEVARLLEIYLSWTPTPPEDEDAGAGL